MSSEGPASETGVSLSSQTLTELDRGWKEAQDLFFSKTGKSLFAGGKKDVEDVMSQLEKRYVTSKESKDEGVKSRAKDIAMKVLTGIKVLAQFAEPIASSVYEPAGYCINAAAILLDIPGNINEVYSGFAHLFESIQSFLIQFKILHRTEQSNKLPVELVENTHKLMISFVRMCAICYKPIAGGKLGRIKLAIGAGLLKYDAGINEELKNFEKLTQNQNNITHSVTLEHLLQTETGVQKTNQKLVSISTDVSASRERLSALREDVHYLVTDTTTRKKDDGFKAILDDIAARLDSNVIKNSENQSKYMESLITDRVSKTGSWMAEENEAGPLFSRWLDFDCEAPPVLGLYGPANSGKSILLSSVWSRLDDMAISGERLVSAFYQFPRADIRSNQKQTSPEDPVITALKCLAFQIAKRNNAYAQELRDVKDITNKKSLIVPRGSTYRECWQALRLSSVKIDLTCALVIDGVDQLPKLEMRQELLELLATQKTEIATHQVLVRSFVTGTASTFEDQIMPTISLTAFNESDVKQFIEQELASDGAVAEFQGAHKDMFETFQSGPIKDERDFGIIRSRISRIKQAVEEYEPEDSVQEIMDRPLEGEKEQVAQEIITDLNENLKDEDIKQLNEMLSWIIYGTRYCFTSDLEQALRVRGFAKESKYVRQKMSDKAKYAKMLMTRAEGWIVPTSPEIETILRKMKRKTSTFEDGKGEDEPRISMDIKVTNATRTTVKKFLWELNQRAIFDPTFFSQAEAVVETKTVIHINALDAHSMIICQCLDILTDEPQSDLKDISKWAVLGLPEHLRLGLQAEIDHGCPLPRRNEIILGLISLLAEPQITVKHWQDLPWLEETWLDDPDPNISLFRWLRGGYTGFDSTDSLQPTDKRRLKKLLDAAGDNGYWYELTKTIGRELLQDEKWKTRFAYGWVKGYVKMLDRVEKEAQEKAEAEAAAEAQEGDDSNEGTNEQAAAETQEDGSQGNEGEEVATSASDQEDTEVAQDSENQLTSADLADQASGDTDGVERAGANGDGEGLEVAISGTSDDDNASSIIPDQSDAEESVKKEETGGKDESKTDEPAEAGEATATDSAEDTNEDAVAADANGSSDATPDEAALKKQMIDRVVQWLQKELKIDVLGALNLRRIADVYWDEDLYPEAIETYKKALDIGKDVTKTRRGLAFAYNWNDQNEEAVTEMEQVFEAYKGGDAKPKDDSELRDDHYAMATWYKILKRPGMALEHYTASMEEEIDFNRYNEYLECLWRSGDDEAQAAFAKLIHEEPEGGEAEGHIVKFLLKSAMNGKQQFMDASLVPLSKRLGAVDLLAKSLKIAREKFESDITATPFDRLSLEVHEHMARIMLDRSPTRLAVCARELSRCSNRLASSSFNRSWLHLKIANLCCQLYFELAQLIPDRADYHIRLAEPAGKHIHDVWSRGGNIRTGTFLIQYYTRAGRKEEAREMILNHVKDAFDLLTDDDLSNDVNAYYSLGDLLIRIDDDDNAMAAWSLVGPDAPQGEEKAVVPAVPDVEVTNENNDTTLEVSAPPAKDHPAPLAGKLNYTCDGDCNRREITYANNFYICRFCPNICFCPDCHEKVKAGTLERFTCHESHEFLYIPPWNEEWRSKIGKDNVVVGGTLQKDSWERVGGEVITISEWLDRLRKDWGIEKPPETKEEEGQEEGQPDQETT